MLIQISPVILFLVYLLYIKIIYYILYSKSVRSSIDNKYYVVRRNNIKKEKETADLLANINKTIGELLSFLETHHKNHKNVDLLIRRYDSDKIMENIDMNSVSYTINKGDKVCLCLSTRDSSDNFYDMNTLMFVVIHELAHIGCESHGHGIEFKLFFSFLLEKAISKGLYKYVDYSLNPVEYCGMMINTTPV